MQVFDMSLDTTSAREFRKKDLKDSINLQSAQLLDLGQAITKFQNVNDSRKQQ
jgi:hypothetical protein